MALDHPADPTQQHGDARPAPSLGKSLLIGSLGFSLVSLCIFATVAFAERWMYLHLSVVGAYLTWTVLFILAGGLVFNSLVAGPKRMLWFYELFGAAFFCYAVGWVSAYFALRGGAAGEWVGSLLGSFLMALVIAGGFRVMRSALSLTIVLFAGNSAGYFLGSWLNDVFQARLGMLLWGAAYGLFLGAGLGAALYIAQTRQAVSARQRVTSDV